jgi:cytochrome c oxidase subunit 1
MTTGTMIRQPAAKRWETGIMSWLTTVDHKKIGLMYTYMSFFFFIVAGIMALLIRTELAYPNALADPIVSAATYNQLFTMHGTSMIFLFIIPIWTGLGNYFVPLQIGARDMAFPRLNAFSFWLALAAGVVMYMGMAFGGMAAAGWTGYPPLSNSMYSPGRGMDLWLLGLQLLGLSSTLGGVNFVVTVANMRAPGMTWFRLPLFTWAVFTAQVMVLFSTPMLAAALTMLLTDRNFGTQFFDANNGDPRMWQHMFWFYSHPAVYIMILPAMGIVSEVLPVFSRKPIFGYTAIVLSTLAIALLGFLTWAHHMFSTSLSPEVQIFFMLTTMIIAVPTGVKMFNWVATLWHGSLDFKTPLLFALGFLALFLIGGLDGAYQGAVPVDLQLHDTYWIVSHLHYVLFGGSVFGLFAGLYFWIPKLTGRMLDERLGQAHFWLMFIGMNLTFFPMHILGLLGMPRRIYDYAPDRGWNSWNLIITIGAYMIAFSVLVFIINYVLAVTLGRGAIAGDDPWEANTLEWATKSPPVPHNFDKIPVIVSERPLRDLRLEGNAVERAAEWLQTH